MILETDRLVLRNGTNADIDDMVEGLNNIEVSKWLDLVPYPYTFKDAEGYLAFCAGSEDSYNFVIELKSEKKVIGGTNISGVNRLHGTATGGIWLNLKYHGYGYGTEAFGKRIEFAFNELDLRRLENGFFDGNESSRKMQEKFGYVVEGKRRKGFMCIADGLYKDEYITGLLREDWERARLFM
jgi:ribosomal-protein-alanine N-acetyltransferase